jgi:hypothetical protein
MAAAMQTPVMAAIHAAFELRRRITLSPCYARRTRSTRADFGIDYRNRCIRTLSFGEAGAILLRPQ